MPLPKKEYLTIPTIAKRWGLEIEDVCYSLFHDKLEACCWFDRRKVDYFEFDGATSYKDWVSGYVGLYEGDCRRVFRLGDIFVTEFYILDGNGAHFHIADKQKPALIHPDQVMVRLCACKEFEKHFDLLPPEQSVLLIQDNCMFFYNGELLSFGVRQQEVIRLLVVAKEKKYGWVDGNILLERAGAKAPRMRDLFRSKPIWRELIESDKHGHYRLHENIIIERSYTKEEVA